MKTIVRRQKWRVIAFLIAVVMIFTLMPGTAAFATNDNGTQAATVKVKFDANGGKLIKSNYYTGMKYAKTLIVKIRNGDKPISYLINQMPERVGYKFKGWYTKKKSGGKKISKNTKAMKAVTYYARWGKAVADYTVTFNPNGGKVVTRSKQVTKGTTYGELPVPQDRRDYAFRGWWTKKKGGKEVRPERKVALNGDTTLYAHWVKTRSSDKRASLTATMHYYRPDLLNSHKPLTSEANQLTADHVRIEGTLYEKEIWDVDYGSQLIRSGPGFLNKGDMEWLFSPYVNDLVSWIHEGWYTAPVGGKEITSDMRVYESMDVYQRVTLVYPTKIYYEELPAADGVHYGAWVGVWEFSGPYRGYHINTRRIIGYGTGTLGNPTLEEANYLYQNYQTNAFWLGEWLSHENYNPLDPYISSKKVIGYLLTKGLSYPTQYYDTYAYWQCMKPTFAN